MTRCDFRTFVLIVAGGLTGSCARPAHLDPVACPPKPPQLHPVRTVVLPAHRGIVRGSVRRDDTEEPLSDASVVLRPGRLGATVDSLGRFQLTQVPPGRYYLEARRVGF